MALEPVLRHIDFRTVVLDDREDYANRDRFPEADEVRVINGFEYAFDGLSLDESSYIIIVTRGHEGDYHVLKDALKQPAVYVGMMGSKRKNAFIFDQLRKIMKIIAVEQSIGTVLAHNLTQIIPGGFKGVRFEKGHVITDEDIPVLLSMGKRRIYVLEKCDTDIHENEAALRVASAVQVKE